MAGDVHSAPTESAARWLVAAVSAIDEVDIEVWGDPLPESDQQRVEIEPPYVSISVMPTPDLHFTGGVRARSTVEATVKVIGEGPSREPILPYVRAIDGRLQNKTNERTPDGALMLQCLRSVPVDYPEVEGSRTYRHLGGLYVLMLTNNQREDG